MTITMVTTMLVVPWTVVLNDEVPLLFFSQGSMWKSKWMSPETLETSSFTTHGDV